MIIQTMRKQGYETPINIERERESEIGRQRDKETKRERERG
jgi:hypothetical protein